MDFTSGDSWAGWFQNVAGAVASKAADAAYVRPYDIAELEIKALGSQGYYTEGQAGTRATASGMGGISPGLLLLGGAALVAVLILRD